MSTARVRRPALAPFAAHFRHETADGHPAGGGVPNRRGPSRTRVPFSDTWSAAHGAPWAASWSTGSGGGAVTVQSGGGRLAVNDVTGAHGRATPTGLAPVADSDLLLSYRWSPGRPLAYVSVYVRRSGGWQNSYRPRNGCGLQMPSTSGPVTVQKTVSGTAMTTLAGIARAQQVGTARQWVRLRVVGPSVLVRVWLDGTPEPSTWTYSTVDTSVAGPGPPYLSLNRASTNVGAVQVLVDDLVVSAATQP